MKLTDALARLLALDLPVCTTGDAAVCLGVDPPYASKILARLAVSGHVVPVSHGHWAFKGKTTALALPSYLTAPFPSYVSLQSALYYHGLISQIPSVTYAVSLARARRVTTALGAISIHHVEPSFFFGFERVGDRGAYLAVPEKALLDVFYLGGTKTRLFAALPEVDLPRTFRRQLARAMIRRIPSPRLRTLVSTRFDQTLEQAT